MSVSIPVVNADEPASYFIKDTAFAFSVYTTTHCSACCPGAQTPPMQRSAIIAQIPQDAVSCVTSRPSKIVNFRTAPGLLPIIGPEVWHFLHLCFRGCVSPLPPPSTHSYPAPRCHGEALFCARKPPSLISRCRSTGLP